MKNEAHTKLEMDKHFTENPVFHNAYGSLSLYKNINCFIPDLLKTKKKFNSGFLVLVYLKISVTTAKKKLIFFFSFFRFQINNQRSMLFFVQIKNELFYIIIDQKLFFDRVIKIKYFEKFFIVKRHAKIS